jgi:hypothetical protein
MRNRVYAIALGGLLVFCNAGQPGMVCSQVSSEATEIRMQNSSDWVFEGGPWSETAAGEMEPPKQFQDY